MFLLILLYPKVFSLAEPITSAMAYGKYLLEKQETFLAKFYNVLQFDK